MSSLEEATPPVLTQYLRESGVLKRGSVAAAKAHDLGAFNSVVARLHLTYTRGAGDELPPSVILKIDAPGGGKEEVAFYAFGLQGARDTVNTSMLVPCYAAVMDQTSGVSNLLLADVSATHASPINRRDLLRLTGVPSPEHLEGVADTLARFHASWWQHPLLGQTPFAQVASSYNDYGAFQARWDKQRGEYEAFARSGNAALTPSVRRSFDEVLQHHESLWTRYLQPRIATRRNLTLTHNDCYLTQFLSPRTTGPTYLVDFQAVCTDFAARDLVYLLATFWTPEQRQAHEEPFLRRYHQTLITFGVKDFSFGELLDDYRLMLTYMMFHPVWDWSYGADEAYWRPKFDCLTEAYQDLRCEKLLYS